LNLKTVILCGGLGTRLSEETQLRPKPLVEIGGKPILWHIMNIFSTHGFNDFVLPLGYKGDLVKEYFLNFRALNSDIKVDLSTGAVEYLRPVERKWSVDLVDTGALTMTGGRLLRLKKYLKDSGTFFLTYGDGVADVDLKKLLAFHKSHGKLVTVTSVRPPARFGNIHFEGNLVKEFLEKPQTGEGWINGGFFVMEPKALDFLHSDTTVLEGDPLERLAKEGQLVGYQHNGFWRCMDTLRDKQSLEELWNSGEAKWKVWND
jgi:glucose-1-phosphate cytidylyltransferase